MIMVLVPYSTTLHVEALLKRPSNAVQALLKQPSDVSASLTFVALVKSPHIRWRTISQSTSMSFAATNIFTFKLTH